MAFVRASNPIWYFVDLQGLGLNDNFYISFLSNTIPYIPQPIFQDAAGTIPWSDPLQFFPNGTLPDNMYWNPNLIWRLEIRKGNAAAPLQSDALIYEINNFVPGQSTITPTPPPIFTADNQATNPQFSTVNFTAIPSSSGQPVLSITAAGTYQIAPGWQLVLTGTGMCTVTQLILSGAAVTPSADNPPYALQINSNLFTTCNLIQQLNQNGAIWNGGAVGFSFTGKANVTATPISLLYNPSGPANEITIFSGILGTGDFTQFGGFNNIPSPSMNTNLSTVAFTQMIIQLPGTCNVDITNVQFNGQTAPLVNPTGQGIPIFQQQTNERSIDQEFHYYANELIQKPKKSILVGWNFPLNPWQFYDPANATPLASVCQYTADQTIIYQETVSGLVVNQNSAIQRQNLLIKAVNGVLANRFAVIQYIDPATIRPYWSYILSSLARMRIVTSHGTQVRMKARLISRTSLPPEIGAAEPITGWDVNGDILFSAGWTAIKPLNDPGYILPNNYDNGLNTTPFSYPAFSYNSFQLPDASTASMSLGLVLYTMDAINQSLGAEDSIEIDKVSLVPNAFAVDTHPQTFDEVLRECQFYYEKSYNVSDLPGIALTNSNAYFAEQLGTDNGGDAAIFVRSFNILFKTVKRIVPVIAFYDPALGTADRVHYYLRNGGNPLADGVFQFSTNWGVLSPSSPTGTDRAQFTATTVTSFTSATATNLPEGFLLFHYEARSRLGLIATG